MGWHKKPKDDAERYVQQRVEKRARVLSPLYWIAFSTVIVYGVNDWITNAHATTPRWLVLFFGVSAMASGANNMGLFDLCAEERYRIQQLDARLEALEMQLRIAAEVPGDD